jgi:hypothetical protein
VLHADARLLCTPQFCENEIVKIKIHEGFNLSLSVNLIIYLLGTKIDIEYFMGKAFAVITDIEVSFGV